MCEVNCGTYVLCFLLGPLITQSQFLEILHSAIFKPWFFRILIYVWAVEHGTNIPSEKARLGIKLRLDGEEGNRSVPGCLV